MSNDSPSQMEPLLIADTRPYYRRLIGLAEDLALASGKLESAIHKETAFSLALLVDGMNCYYSNQMEGHHTRPIDIEIAMKREGGESLTSIQQLAGAHIDAAIWARATSIKDIGLSEFICAVHRKFYSQLPSEMLNQGGVKIIPGKVRTLEVSVGRHVAPNSASIADFLARFDQVYGTVLSKSGKGGLYRGESILASMAAHHRLVWIHPFLDGNGRTARIVTDAMLRESGLPGVGLWALSRGFARNGEQYKALLDAADAPRKGDLDGRGSLSESALADFCEFALIAAIDQVKFMSDMFRADDIERRISHLLSVSGDVKSIGSRLYARAFKDGGIERGDAPGILGIPERTARDILKTMLDKGYLVSDSPKGRVKAGFPPSLLEYAFPRLYPSDEVFRSEWVASDISDVLPPVM